MKSRHALHKILPASAVPDSHANDPVKPHPHGPKTKRVRVTCPVFWKEYKVQMVGILKTATAITVALLWSTTVSYLFDAIFSAFYQDGQYKQLTLGVGFAVVSVAVFAAVPVIAFKYAPPDDYWGIAILIEILGHLWGFKIKDLIVYLSYRQHYLYGLYASKTVVDTDVDFSFCNLVASTFVVVTPDVNVSSTNLGWEGYNLDWTNYTYNRSVFDDYYDVDPCGGAAAANATNASNASNTTTGSSRRHLGGSSSTGCTPAPAPHRRALAGDAYSVVPAPSPFEGDRVDMATADALTRGPGRTCNFEYRTTRVLKGFRVEKVLRPVYLWELGSRVLIWAACLSVCVVSVVVIRAVYNKLILPNCCKRTITHRVQHNWSHIQNHLIADAWANGMGWVSAWFFWWLTICCIMLLSNLTETSPCNGMHAFPLAGVALGLGVFFALVSMLLYLRIHIWARMLVCCSGIKRWLGGVGELQNGFMLGWFLIAWVEYFHATFISPYIEDGFEDYSPFDDIHETHHAATVILALEELGESLVWTALGLLHLTSQKLQIKASHRETTLLKEAKRRLQNYFALTRTFATTKTASEIAKLVDERKQWAVLLEKRALIESRAVGIWMGLTIELAIHIFISLLEKSVKAFYVDGGAIVTGGSGGYSTFYSSSSYAYAYSSAAYDYQDAAIRQSIVFGVNFAVSAALTGIFYAVLFCSHHMSWRISTERERQLKLYRGFRQRHLAGVYLRRSLHEHRKKRAHMVSPSKREADDVDSKVPATGNGGGGDGGGGEAVSCPPPASN